MKEEKSIYNQRTLLENLPNELFVQIFSYLNGVDIIFAFLKLNQRFENLLFEFCQYFDFKSINKTIFDLIYQLHFTQQWKSLRLSNDDDTPGQIQYFFLFDSFANLCPQLQSLSLYKLNIQHNYNTLFDQIESLTNLQSLSITSVCGKTMHKLNLPKLERLVLSSCTNTKWLENFLQVKSIEYTIIDCSSCKQIPIWPLKLKRLKITFEKDDHLLLIQKSFTHLSQLISLEIYQKQIGRSLPNGLIWEDLIHLSLPLLKNFKFYFMSNYFVLNNYYNSPNEIQQLIASFSTPFYISEKQWLINIDVSEPYPLHIFIYTIPFTFDQCTIFANCSIKNTKTYCNHHNNIFNNNVYQDIKTLVYADYGQIPDKRLNNARIHNLIITIYFNPFDWIHILTELRHLEINDKSMISSDVFHFLLDNTPQLNSLIVEKYVLRVLTENWNHVHICSHLSEKIRRLKLLWHYKRDHNLTRNELEQIIRIFALKCQHLSLTIHSPNNSIGFILQNMSQLQSLHVHIKEKYYSAINSIWLKQQQTKFNNSNCVIVNDKHDHYFWLG